MPFTKFTNLDFDQIKDSIKSYLRANSDFTGFDFEGSNFSVLIDTLAYNTYITAFNSNMIVNESFLDSATLRENVVSLARNVGYIPRSRTAAEVDITLRIQVTDEDVSNFTLKKGLVCVGDINNTSHVFSLIEDVTTSSIELADGGREATFTDLKIYQGTFLTKKFVVDNSLNQRFILDNPYIDASKLKVYVSNNESQLGFEYRLVGNIVDTDKNSEIYILQEIEDEKYEILFGDGLIGKKLENGAIITVDYIVSDGEEGNGIKSFSFSGNLEGNTGSVTKSLTLSNTDITVHGHSTNGSEIESIDSIKYYAPRVYGSQNRAVTSNDYESIIKKIYPNTESVTVVGGEELNPPRYGTVQIYIKPNNGFFVSDFDKTRILSSIKNYSISGINQEIVDLKILYVELDSSVYYNDSKISSPDTLKNKITNSIVNYSNSIELNKFGGRFKYSKVLNVIDSSDSSITSNITKVKIRRNLFAAINQFAQYELCFGNRFHVNPEGFNIKSTGFYVPGESSLVYITDIPNEDKRSGVISVVKISSDKKIEVISKSAGTIDYIRGEIILNTINITGTQKPNNIVEIQAFPESNDVVGLNDLYINLDVSKTQINILRDVISSGEEISGSVFIRDSYTSSYSNGSLIRE